MKKLLDGSWEIRVPLMSEDVEVVTISPDEILPQENPFFMRRNVNNSVILDMRWKLLPVKGKEGLQVLEAAYIKQKFGLVDRLSAEGGQGDEVLMSLGRTPTFKGYAKSI